MVAIDEARRAAVDKVVQSQVFLNALVGQGIQSPLASQPYPYTQQFNFDVQKQFRPTLTGMWDMWVLAGAPSAV